MTDRERLDAFLKELTDLSEKHDIFIGGCGCCGSPYLYSNEDEKFDKENLCYFEGEGYCCDR